MCAYWGRICCCGRWKIGRWKIGTAHLSRNMSTWLVNVQVAWANRKDAAVDGQVNGQVNGQVAWVQPATRMRQGKTWEMRSKEVSSCYVRGATPTPTPRLRNNLMPGNSDGLPWRPALCNPSSEERAPNNGWHKRDAYTQEECKRRVPEGGRPCRP